MTNGLLLINLGTPDAPHQTEVRRYLREFLSDPRVIDIHPLGRAALLNLFILPTRPRKSAAAYQKIWTDRGSPLLAYSQDLTAGVQERLGPAWLVKLGMRYGSPPLGEALLELVRAGVQRLVVLPLYPQYSAASTGSSIEEVFRVAGALWVTPNLSLVEPFFDDPGFISAFASRGRPVLQAERPDHVLFSYHGLPERQIRKADDTGTHCLAQQSCCDRMVAANRSCYRAQCYATTRLLAAALNLSADDYTVCFQSRLGRTPWVRPYTDVVLPELRARGKQRIVVFCPAFVADCLETLEEIGIRARADFLAAGGESLTLVPSLNATPEWIEAVVGLVQKQANLYRDPPPPTP
jgi:ferrochelatase